MKKTVLVSLLIVCTNLICFSNNFNFDGISFEHAKGWKIIHENQNYQTLISGDVKNVPLKLTIVKEIANGLGAENHLTTIIDSTEESLFLLKKKYKLKSKSNIDERIIGEEIITMSVEFIFSNNIYQRHFVFEKHGYLFHITITGSGKKYEMLFFSQILNSFSFNPE